MLEFCVNHRVPNGLGRCLCQLSERDTSGEIRRIYEIAPVGLFEKINEGRFFRLRQTAQTHVVIDGSILHMSWSSRHQYNNELINWIDDNTRGDWNIALGDPVDLGSHQVWSFSNVNDALLFKLTWHHI